MKRSEALTPLSHDHHHALMVAMGLRRADAESARTAAEAFLEFWRAEGQRHFREEEDLLLPAFATYGDVNDPLVGRALIEHVTIRAQAQALIRESPAPEVESLHRLGAALAEHVRMEERELFPLIEATLPPAALTALGEALSQD